jgi:ubiquinol-cytochrome c reductase cytochrome b subunit
VTVAERHARTGLEGNFWPDQAYKDMVACLFVFAALVGIVCYAQFSGNSLGSGLDAPADAAGDYPARPEWYFLFLFQLLKYFEGPIGTMVIPGAAATFLFLLPLLDKGLPARLAHGLAVFGVVAGLGAVGWLTYAAIRYDQPPTEADYAANPDSANNRDKFQKQIKKAAQDREKFLAFARDHGIPPEGPLAGFRRIEESLMHPGEKVFIAQCKVCHSFGKHEGGDNSDLNDYGTAKWLAGFLKDPGHKRFLGEYYSTLDEKQRGMIRWRKQAGAKLSDAQIDAVAEVLLDVRSHPKLAQTDFDSDQRGADLIPLVSPALAGRLGEAPLQQAASVLTRDCLKCHRIGAASGGAMAAPVLNGYAAREWVRQLIRDSHSDDLYGPRSKMPKFSPEKIGDAPMEALLDFLLKPPPTPTAG